MDAQIESPFVGIHYGERFDVRTDLDSLKPEDWTITDAGMESNPHGRVREYELVATVCEGGSKSGREYKFMVQYDLLTGTRVGYPALDVSYYLDDLYKPNWEPLMSFSGPVAGELHDMLKTSLLLAAEAQARPLAASRLPRLEPDGQE